MSEAESLYAKSEKIFPREVAGRFQQLRGVAVITLLGLYYILPFFQWDGRQAVLFDLPARKFHIFFLSFWPQDFFFLAVLLVMAGVLLFFVTSVAGRVWCGYACPQTVWTEAFVWMERWVEGSRAQQIKLDKAAWNYDKWRKRIIKQVLWVSFSLFTGLIFVGYFVPIREFIPDFFTLNISGWALFWVLFYSFATYGNAGYMREQVCMYMCPYARFQSAMFDHDTLIVAYDEARGEPRERGKRRRSQGERSGDCIDCGLCVQVCPTGIDIRDGLQYECIACAACIDVCDDVMHKTNLPKGLIRYSTQAQDHGQEKTRFQTILRPRVLIYATILGCVFAAWVTALALRKDFQVDILRDRNSLYRVASDGRIENLYQIKMINKSERPQRYLVSVGGVDRLQAQWLVGQQTDISQYVSAGDVGDLTLSLSVPASQPLNRVQSVKVTFREAEGDSPQQVTEETRFWGPN